MSIPIRKSQINTLNETTDCAMENNMDYIRFDKDELVISVLSEVSKVLCSHLGIPGLGDIEIADLLSSLDTSTPCPDI